jgi:hypothetical protein
MKASALLWSSAVLLALIAAFLFAQSVLATLFLGWLRVVAPALQRIEVNAGGIATGIVCAAVTIFLLHRFAAWLYREIRGKNDRSDWPSSWRWPWTLCVVFAVMLMFVAGLAGVGLFRTTSWFLQTPVIFTEPEARAREVTRPLLARRAQKSKVEP